MSKIALSAGVIGCVYKIIKIECKNSGLCLHLKHLGICVGKNVSILKFNYFKNAMLVDVGDTKVALDKMITDGIVIENE